MKILFFGTDDFALPSLKALAECRHELVALTTQPDKPKGRGRKVEASPIKKFALDRRIPCLQPETPNDPAFLAQLKSASGGQADLIVLVAYGHLLKKELLEFPRFGGINLHPSLLPKYRGAAPIQWAIWKGEKTTGVTTIQMSEKIDAGEILLQRDVSIGNEETYGELSNRLSEIGAQLLLETLDGIEAGKIKGRPQDEREASRAPKIEKEDYQIDWGKPGLEISNQIRALSPIPGAFTFFRGERMEILAGRFEWGEGEKDAVGRIFLSKKELKVATEDGFILLLRIKPAGRREMDAQDFINGFRPIEGEIFG